MKTLSRLGMITATLGFGIVAAGAMGCADNQAPDEDPGAFPDEAGQPDWNPEKAYPTEVGYVPGRSLPNLKFMGYADYSRPDLNTFAQHITMADFYNPDGQQEYGETDYWTGPKPKVVVVTMSAVWCPPCNDEAANLWPPKSQEYMPQGVQFVSLLLQDNNYGPATFNDLANWANAYMVNWDSIAAPNSVYNGPTYILGLDPTENLLALFDPAFPGNMIVRTSDMKIMYRAAGTAVDFDPDPSNPNPVQDFWDVLNGVLDGSITEPILKQL